RPHHGHCAARFRAFARSGGDPASHPGRDRLLAGRRHRRREDAGAGVALIAAASAGFRHALELGSNWALALILVGIPVSGYLKGVKVYEAFVEGAKEGFQVAVRIIPFLVAILAAVGAFRAAGAMDGLAHLLGPVTSRIGLPPALLPMAIARPRCGGGSLRLLGSL